MCVVEMKHCAFGSISHFLKPIEKSGTEDRTETILPPSSLFPLRPLSLSTCVSSFLALCFYAPIFLSLHNLNRLQFRTCTTCLETSYTTDNHILEGEKILNDNRILLQPIEWIHPGFVLIYCTSSAMRISCN